MAQAQQTEGDSDHAEAYKLVRDHGDDLVFDTWEAAQEKLNEAVEQFPEYEPDDFRIKPVTNTDEIDESMSDETDETPESNGRDAPEPQPVDVLGEDTETVLSEMGASVVTDPLDVLPDYMIDTVQGTPTLNKRGLSVLAFHYGISVTGREKVVTPHDSDWQYAIVETTVENDEGNTFVGTGTAHVDRDDEKGVLLELAETRSYKRAVSFATGTGIVSYQELTGELE